MSLFRRVLFLLFLLFTFYSCGHGQRCVFSEGLPAPEGTISFKFLGNLQGNVISVEDTIDLHNRACSIPEGYLLKVKGGYIKNGTLIGNETRLKSSKACFKRVKILGTWNVPIIKSSLFDDLTYDNALKDVLALSDSLVNNKIYIGEGNYQVTARKHGDVCLSINSNTEIIINGVIKLTPNKYKNYYIIRASGDNIIIRGKGNIVGDKHTHTGDSGEWGMGIDVENAHNILISHLTINDCWGDCIYVGSNSTNVRIENCRLDHGRRQGISVTSAEYVTIKKCVITNVGGTNPGYAIDLEPNSGDTVKNIVIDHVEVINCMGGLDATRSRTATKGGAYVGEFTIKNCSISVNQKYPIRIRRFSKATIDNCVISTNNDKASVHVTEADSLIVKNNRIIIYKSLVSSVKNELYNVVGKGEGIPLHFQKCRSVISDKNIIIEK